MKKLIIFFSCIAIASVQLHATLTPQQLTCEYLVNPMAVDVLQPRLSWINLAEAGERGQTQTAWEIWVAGSKEKLRAGKPDLWSSGKIFANNSVNIRYEGKKLASRQDCWWQVRVWDAGNKVSVWSEPAFWFMGILNPGEWKAQWIGAPWQGEQALPKPVNESEGQPKTDNELPPPAPLLRKGFTVEKEIRSARAYVTGLGFFELYVNGKKVSQDVMVPNLTLYGKRPGLENNYISLEDKFREYRVMYLSYDIKDLLTKGENVVGAILGNGFYNAPVKWTQSYGSPRFLGQIHILYTDGSEKVITSDPSWKVSRSPIVMDLIYDGEYYDARMEQPGWSKPGFNDSSWEPAALRKAPGGNMKAQMSPPDRVMESLAPQKIEQLGEGHYKVDFGQEISGWLHLLQVTGKAGTKIGIKYICESPVGSNSYTLKGGGPESYAARFTWFVFRTVELTNWPGLLKPEQLRAEAVYTQVETTGKFECSNPLFNTINKIWWRSQTDNMHGCIASDCPHRERSPYTGDGQVSCVTVMHNFDARTFYTKWIQDILGAQNPETGYVPNGAPWQPGCGGGVAWGAAMNIMPWEFYRQYGDLDMLRNNYEGMKGYIKYMLTWTDAGGIMFSQAPDKANPNEWLNLGDWVAPGKLPPNDMVHTFYLWRCADITARVAHVLGRSEDEGEYEKLAERTRQAFQKKFYDPEKGSYGPYGGNIFALRMGVPSEQREKVISALKADILANGSHLDTGIFGTQFFFEVLSENGLHELACEVMNQRSQPGYGWWIDQGATTTWEEWNGNGSRNHPMFGGGIVWFYRKLAGMNTDPDEPGYRHIIFRPQPANDISSVSYSNLTAFGTAAIAWKKENGSLSMQVTVPVSCRASVYVPAAKKEAVTESGHATGNDKHVVFVKMEDGYALFSIGSGTYDFQSQQ
jgi:alpha-L-rhamnosidase